MRFRLRVAFVAAALSVALSAASLALAGHWPNFSAGEADFEESDDALGDATDDPYAWMETWERPPGPPRVGIQIGHWKREELPDEFERLRSRGGGTRGGGRIEWEVNLDIGSRVAELLRREGIVVDVLPATVPQEYVADAFIAIHADGSTNAAASGYKIASPRRDWSGKSELLTGTLIASYGAMTALPRDPNVTRSMRGYYAFNWRRYAHAIHPMTPAVIVELGFLTSPHDQRILVGDPDRAARGIAVGVLRFIRETVPNAN